MTTLPKEGEFYHMVQYQHSVQHGVASLDVPSSNCSFSQPQLFPAMNGVTYIPEPSPSEMYVQKTATLSATTVNHPYPSPPYSAPINSSFKNLFSSQPDTTIQYGHPSFLSFPSNATTVSVSSEAPLKSYPPLELQSSVTSQLQVIVPGSLSFIPTAEPSSPYPCQYSPTASYWNHPLKHDGSWSAPPVPREQSSHNDPAGTNGFRSVSPISPLSPLYAAAPTNEQPLVSTEPPPLAPVPLDASYSQLPWPGPPTFSEYLEYLLMQPKHHRALSCVNGVNSEKRPFVCPVLFCTKAYTTFDQLKRHLRVHYEDVRFFCKVCGKGFVRSDHLTNHKNIHQKLSSDDSDSSSSENKDLSPSYNSPESPLSETFSWTSEVLDLLDEIPDIDDEIAEIANVSADIDNAVADIDCDSIA